MKQYDVMGMNCAACSARVEKAVSSLEGVTSCSVNLLTNSMSVSGDVEDSIIISAVEKAGYGAAVKGETPEAKSSNSDENKTEIKVLRNRFVFSAIVLLGLMYCSMGHTMFGFPLPEVFENSPSSIGLLQLLFSAIVMIANQKFFINGFKGLLNRSPNMDTLVALGSASAFAYSVVVLFIMFIDGVNHLHGLYFESAAMVLTLITLGKMLEAMAKGKTTSALKGLINLAPKKATVIRNGTERLINAEEIVVDDIFIVHPGESIPVDGVVIEGTSSIDESALTGESIPADKNIGSEVITATINLTGYLKCKAKRVGNDTTLAQIIQVVNNASATKAPIAKIADKVSGVFVPAVILIAIATLTIWLLIGKDFGFSLARAISVLVISCPCALGLATPVAVMVGSGVGAKNGILFKTALALELTGKAQMVAFDKTGTITEGKLKLTDIIPSDNTTTEELIEIAAALEKNSEHPLAKAINEYAESKGVLPKTVTNFEVFPGGGLCAQLNGNNIFGGNLKFISPKVTVDINLINKAEELAKQGKTPLYFAKNDNVLGIIAAIDTIKSDSKEAVRELNSMGIRTVMITGDNDKTAKNIADSVGIFEVYSNVVPTQKEQIIKDLQTQGKVIMVGDGINDAPALTRADIGIAVGTGTDIAVDAADVVIMKSKMTDVVSALKLSRRVIRNIHQNLFWAFGYNVIGIPLAAGLFVSFGFTLNPMFGAAAMSISSFLVVSNALRLNLTKFTKNEERKTMEKLMKIEGMMCGHCEARVKSILEAMPNVASAEVSHKDGTAKLMLSGEVNDSALKTIVEEQGYTVLSIEG